MVFLTVYGHGRADLVLLLVHQRLRVQIHRNASVRCQILQEIPILAQLVLAGIEIQPDLIRNHLIITLRTKYILILCALYLFRILFLTFILADLLIH